MGKPKRASNKVQLNLWMDRDLREAAKEILKEKNMSMSAYITLCFQALLKDRSEEIWN